MHIGIEEIVALMKNMKDNGITGLKVVRGRTKLELNRESVLHVPRPDKIAMPASDDPVKVASPSSEEAVTGSNPEEGRHPVTSPLVGTFYNAPSPDAPPFVSNGDLVQEGQTLCIVEAMKTMNEIKADRPGMIREICVENGQLVEYGQPLFMIREG